MSSPTQQDPVRLAAARPARRATRRPRRSALLAAAGLTCWALLPVSAQDAAGLSPTPIHRIQGAGHLSPLDGQRVRVEALVAALGPDGLVFLASTPGTEDDDPATSQGLHARLPADHGLTRGQWVSISGTIRERRPGNRASNLTLTELVETTEVLVIGRGELPAPVVLGAEGRPVPAGVIDDDSEGHVERAPSVFDPDEDAIDFFESLEGMAVVVPAPVVVGSTSRYGECVVIADGGRDNPSLAPDGALVIADGDFNPERLTIDDGLQPVPEVSLGARFAGPLVGFVSYDWGLYRVLLSEPAPAADGGRSRDRAEPAAEGALRIASYNVENLAASGPAWRFERLATQIVDALASPDLIGLQEIQDDSGPTDDGTVSAAGTLAALVAAIDAAGGPTYTAHEIAPVDGADGGQPGGNIRVAYLLRDDSALELVARPGGAARLATSVTDHGGRPALSHSPGRVAPGDPAWNSSRVPLALELRWRGEPLFVVDNHWASKGGDDGLFGPVQPPVRLTEVRRGQQSRVVADFVQQLLDVQASARVIVLGDLNEFGFRPAVTTLEQRTGLVDLVGRLPPLQRWTYVYQGNAQALDHLLVSPGLLAATEQDFAVVHLNAAWVDGVSDHDPLLLTLRPRDD